MALPLLACTKSNPAASCSEGACSDPAFPFCDAEGLFSNTPGSCIAVTCTPGEIALCVGDEAIVCADDGAAYEHVLCDLGCVDLPQPHCAYIEPRYLPDICDAPASQDSFAPTSSGTFDPNFDTNCNGGIVAQTGAPGICVLHYRTISIPQDVTLTVTGTLNMPPGRAIAFVADEELVIDGILDLSALRGISGPGGGVILSGGTTMGNNAKPGGGGAGGKTAGAPGATDTQDGGAANGGAQAADPSFLAVLVGGAAAAQGGNPGQEPLFGGGGGGAGTLVSCRSALTVRGTIDAGGGGGMGGLLALASFPGAGGGAGGYVVLQGKEIAVTGMMFANGGGGGAGMRADQTNGSRGQDGSLSDTDGARGGNPFNNEGAGGNGGVGSSAPTSGKKPTQTPATGGGGGGSVGFFQTYTPAGRTPSLTPSAISPDFQPNGVIRTR